MAYKLQINEPTMNLNFHVKYENLAKDERPDVEAKAPDGTIVKERSTYQGQVLAPGSTQRQWCDDSGKVYSKQELTFYYDGNPVKEISQTKVMTITEYQDISSYTDLYVISKYYEMFPHDNDMKKDFDREVAVKTNVGGMYKFWKYLHDNQKVARGEFCPSSKGFVTSDGYIRAISIGNKWGLELGVFKEAKVFQHLNLGVPVVTTQQPAMAGASKIKRI